MATDHAASGELLRPRECSVRNTLRHLVDGRTQLRPPGLYLQGCRVFVYIRTNADVAEATQHLIVNFMSAEFDRLDKGKKGEIDPEEQAQFS